MKAANIDVDMVKASTLLEALPYIQRFRGSVIVVKYGGSAMLDDTLKHNVIQDVALLKLIGMKPIIVHGGGKEINKWVRLTGKEPQFVNGLRVTDKDTMEIAVCGNEDRILLLSRYDNLGKGASGAAVQCLNLVLGVEPTTGLEL